MSIWVEHWFVVMCYWQYVKKVQAVPAQSGVWDTHTYTHTHTHIHKVWMCDIVLIGGEVGNKSFFKNEKGEYLSASLFNIL